MKMFIKLFNDHRININSIEEYYPYETINKSYQYYYVKIKFINGKEENIQFTDIEKRDLILKHLDDQLILPSNINMLLS